MNKYSLGTNREPIQPDAVKPETQDDIKLDTFSSELRRHLDLDLLPTPNLPENDLTSNILARSFNEFEFIEYVQDYLSDLHTRSEQTFSLRRAAVSAAKENGACSVVAKTHCAAKLLNSTVMEPKKTKKSANNAIPNLCLSPLLSGVVYEGVVVETTKTNFTVLLNGDVRVVVFNLRFEPARFDLTAPMSKFVSLGDVVSLTAARRKPSSTIPETWAAKTCWLGARPTKVSAEALGSSEIYVAKSPPPTAPKALVAVTEADVAAALGKEKPVTLKPNSAECGKLNNIMPNAFSKYLNAELLPHVVYRGVVVETGKTSFSVLVNRAVKVVVFIMRFQLGALFFKQVFPGDVVSLSAVPRKPNEHYCEKWAAEFLWLKSTKNAPVPDIYVLLANKHAAKTLVADTPEAKTPITKTPAVNTPTKTPESKTPVTKTPTIKTPIVKLPVAKAQPQVPAIKTPIVTTPVTHIPIIKTPITQTPIGVVKLPTVGELRVLLVKGASLRLEGKVSLPANKLHLHGFPVASVNLKQLFRPGDVVTISTGAGGEVSGWLGAPGLDDGKAPSMLLETSLLEFLTERSVSRDTVLAIMHSVDRRPVAYDDWEAKGNYSEDELEFAYSNGSAKTTCNSFAPHRSSKPQLITP